MMSCAEMPDFRSMSTHDLHTVLHWPSTWSSTVKSTFLFENLFALKNPSFGLAILEIRHNRLTSEAVAPWRSIPKSCKPTGLHDLYVSCCIVGYYG